MKIPYNILIQIKMSVRPYFKGFTLIFFFYNCRKQDYIILLLKMPTLFHNLQKSLNCKTQRKGSIAINQARKYVL